MKDAQGKDYVQLAGMIAWKDRNPKVKVIWSLGGWSYSRPFYDMAKNKDTRTTFIESVIRWLD